MTMVPLVRVEVAYQFTEYREIVRHFMLREIEQSGKKLNRKLPWNRPLAEKVVLNLVLALMFWYKKFRVGTGLFEFTETGLSRTSKGGVSSRSWDQVKDVFRIQNAYLIELKEGGAMPLPHRVLPVDAKNTFETLLSRASL
jgi:hypothetical protein